LGEWAARLADWGSSVDVYAYFNNDWEVFAPRNALDLRRMVGALTGAEGAGTRGAAGAGGAGTRGAAAAGGAGAGVREVRPRRSQPRRGATT
ncbi:MAG: hypothetical protein QOE31_2164, partial [Solirubrobacteraceae bacterium]|nr:hypothetical protein [Solirubrobacteraceae bacterium]